MVDPLQAAIDALQTTGQVVSGATDAAKPKTTVKTRNDKAIFLDVDGKPLAIEAVLGLSSLYAVDKSGWPSVDKISFDVEMLRAPSSTKPVAPGDVVVQLGDGSQMTLAPGAAVVLGKPDSGKSLLANTMLAQNPSNVEIIRFREPEADSLLSERAFVEAFYKALYVSDARVVFVDSLRTTFYTSSGPTGKGGVNMAIFTLLTAYDIIARRAGKVIFFALNPMSTDDVAIEYYLEASRGSVSHTLSATAPKFFKISSRSNKTRSWQDGRYSPEKQTAAVGFRPLREANHLSVESSYRDDFSIVDLYVVNQE